MNRTLLKTVAVCLLALLSLSGLMAPAEEAIIEEAELTVNEAPAEALEIAPDADAIPPQEEVPAVEANAGAVPINKTNFPAKDFRNYVKQNFDTNGDGKLSKAEAKSAKSIYLEDMSCPNMKGIEHFTNLTDLSCVYCGVKKLNVTKNTKLQELDCSGNKLTALNVTKCTKLVYLNCSKNALTALNVTKCTKLQELDCHSNALTALNVTKCPKLIRLSCNDNALKKLNVTKSTKLQWLDCSENKLTALNVTKCPKLSKLYCESNVLKKLNIGSNKQLVSLHAEGNQITSIDLKNNAYLRACQKTDPEYEDDSTIGWESMADDETESSIVIDKTTKLTSGTKVLYKGA